jgi:hypothetical protein
MMLDLDQPQERPLQVAKALASTIGLLHSLNQVLAPPDSDFILKDVELFTLLQYESLFVRV